MVFHLIFVGYGYGTSSPIPVYDMKIQVLFFASTREITGLSKLDVDISSPDSTTDDLKTELSKRYPSLKFTENHINIAVNKKYVTEATLLKDGDQVALIPPIAGG